MANAHVSDSMIRRLETELREAQTFANGLIERANSAERDLSEDESKTLGETRGRMTQLKTQIEQLEDYVRIGAETEERRQQFDQAVKSYKGGNNGGSPVEYRSAGCWALDMYKSALNDREAKERLELYYRSAAHVTTPDNLGVVPDPIVGSVINFIDAARPLVNVLGPRPMPSATWHRPLVTQHTTVGKQGGTGASDKEKQELVSQKMTITRLTANAVTYGGYVNVSRQLIDFSNAATLDAIINDLAAQYAIETEGALCDEIATTDTSAVTYPSGADGADLAATLWSAAATAYTAVKGQGSLVLAVAPDVLGTFGPLFAPYGPFNSFGEGFNASQFGQGRMGGITGINVVMSAGLGAGEAFLFSTAAIEVYEQRVGTLQVTEPSVMGVQVAYAGYFTPLTILNDAIIPITVGS